MRHRVTEQAALARDAAERHDVAVREALDRRGADDRRAEAWSLVADLPGEADAINLDRADAFFTALERLAQLG